MTTYFADFHANLFPHLNGKVIYKTIHNTDASTEEANGIATQEDFYGNIFSWYTGDDSNTILDKSNLERWMNSQRPLPKKILSQALHNPSIAVDQYDIIFQRFEKILAQFSPGSSGMCLDVMEALLKSYPISLGFDSKYCITAKAFTTALVCDAILSDTKFIAGTLRSIVNKKMTTCQKNNCRFSFPYLLEILLNPPYRLLEKMLDHCSDEIYGGSVNLKEEWRQKTVAYTDKT